MAKKRNKSKGSDTTKIVMLLSVIFFVIALLVVLFGQGLMDEIQGVSSSETDSARMAGVGGESSGVNMHSANSICQSALRAKYREQIKQISFDARSSKLDRHAQMFKLFYSIDLAVGDTIVRDTWAYCNISSSTGVVDEIRVKSDSNRLFNFFGF